MIVNNIITKEVVFNGDVLVATHDLNIDKVYVAVRWVCEGIGLTLNQTKRQIKNIQEDEVIKKGVSNLTLPTNGGVQRVICIEIDFLPLWLAKISITPSMKKNKPEVVEKLIQYQLKAKDILYEAFIKKQQFQIPASLPDALRLAADLAEKAEKYSLMLEANNSVDMCEASKVLGLSRNKIFEFLRSEGILMDEPRKNLPYQQYMKYFEVIEVMRNGKIYAKTLVKPCGIDYIYKKAKEKGLIKTAS